tara:strand:- start:5211 stop:5771 length:561 start_codon:yes stop_codon:yes gene_type:complete
MITESLFQNSLYILVFVIVSVGIIGCESKTVNTETIKVNRSSIDSIKKQPTLPAPSSIISAKDDLLIITAEELVRGITKNSVKKNIKEYFGKSAEITGDVMSITKGRDTPIIELVLEGNNGDAEVAYVMCVITDYDQAEMDAISVGHQVTVTGKITAMAEVPGEGMVSFFTERNFQAQIVKSCNVK